MSAQGGIISGRAPLHLPIRSIVAMIVVATTAAAIGFAAIQITGNDARDDTSVVEREGYWRPTTGHPAVQGRPGSMGAEVTGVPAQRLYPDGFSARVKNDTPQRFERMRRKW
jgi:hypothetical protein